MNALRMDLAECELILLRTYLLLQYQSFPGGSSEATYKSPSCTVQLALAGIGR